MTLMRSLCDPAMGTSRDYKSRMPVLNRKSALLQATLSNCGDTLKPFSTKHRWETSVRLVVMTQGTVKTRTDVTMGNPQPSPYSCHSKGMGSQTRWKWAERVQLKI